MAYIGIILAAGNQTRFDSEKPKALVDINGKSLLERNISEMKKYCKEVYTVVGREDEAIYKEYTDNIITTIKGLGSGDALSHALYILEYKGLVSPDDVIIFKWGDALHFDDKVYEDLVKATSNPDTSDCFIVPGIIEHNPYVKFDFDLANKSCHVSFSKYGEVKYPCEGIHDLSIFACKFSVLYTAVEEFVERYLGKDMRHYDNQPKGEFEILRIINEDLVMCYPIVYKKNNSFGIKASSFNTISELEDIRKEVSCKDK